MFCQVLLLLHPLIVCLLNCCFLLIFVFGLVTQYPSFNCSLGLLKVPPPPSCSCSAWEHLSSKEGCLHQPAKPVLINWLSASIWQSGGIHGRKKKELKRSCFFFFLFKSVAPSTPTVDGVSVKCLAGPPGGFPERRIRR